MEFELTRLRRGEVIAGASAVVLLALTFLLPWYERDGEAARDAGVPTSVDGWNGLTTLRWLILLTIIAALALAILQGIRKAPALPVSFSVIATVLGALTVIALVYRVLIDVPGFSGPVDQAPGAYLGLIAACALTYGAFRSLRQEDPPDGTELRIRTVTLGRET